MISTTFKLIKSAGATVLILLFAGMAMAQPGQKKIEKREKAEAMKIGFITNRLNLTQDEAKKFWPVYNQFQDELSSLRQKRRGNRRDARQDFDQLSDKETEKVVDDEILFRQSELDILKKYHAQFKQVLPIKKVAMLYQAEEDFKKELLRQLKDRRDAR
ncbi:MAG: hypothetical protein JST71_07155 [Bacteroidetes bacterium]|nr:hypothetical protein [Bacteroidota bacterium]MBX7238070.1 lipase family protein [Bacteroidia bacterium]MCC7513152.1 hypothetical protein [Bacteroidia bacterium]MCW5919102.1 hypothetical protein [Bacteroidota bacterium]HCI57931.1 hypothetical protein [Bacteroidota bacterium]